MIGKVVFDAYAVLELLENGPGAGVVEKLIKAEAVTAFLSLLSLGEVYYITRRRRGERAAEKVIEAVFWEESLVPVEATWPRIKAAAAVKAGGGLSYADCFILALAEEEKAPLVTGDPEIISRAKKTGLELIDISGQIS